MRYVFLFAVIILITVGIYLNQSYAKFFDKLSAANLTAPPITQYYIEGKNNNEKIIHYAALGDSLTAGIGASEYQQTYPYIIALKIAKNVKQVKVLNLSKPGAKVVDYTFDTQLIKNTDLVSILIGTNDVFNSTPKDRFMSQYQDLINTIRSQTQGQIIILTIPYLGSEKTMILPYRAYLNLKINQLNQYVKQLAVQNNLQVIDLHDLSGEHFDQDNSLYSSDQFHPSSKGYIIWGDLINENWNFKP